jgi:hypothetical protein
VTCHERKVWFTAAVGSLLAIRRAAPYPEKPAKQLLMTAAPGVLRKLIGSAETGVSAGSSAFSRFRYHQ